ncbi:MAG TPA: hypothetical protein VFE96_08650 [Candidatus Bathyarchaeia archaeon]|nr:hypothetical protein [Candidatus Bathyarchaeia archaeon]
MSEEELMNRVIRAKAQVALAMGQSVILRTQKETFEITPKLAKKLLREPRASKP